MLRPRVTQAVAVDVTEIPLLAGEDRGSAGFSQGLRTLTSSTNESAISSHSVNVRHESRWGHLRVRAHANTASQIASSCEAWH